MDNLSFMFYKKRSKVYQNILLGLVISLFVFAGPLLNEDLAVGRMPFEQYKNLTFCLSGRGQSRLLYTAFQVFIKSL